MSRTRRYLVFGGVAFVILCILLGCLFLAALIRTLTLQEEIAHIEFRDAPTIDDVQLQKFVKIMGDSLKFKTVSKSADDYDTNELLLIQKFLRDSYPVVFNSSFVEVETVNSYSLLLTVKGTDPSILPFMLTSHLDVVPVDPNEWSHPPFLGEVIADPDTGEDCVWGRGAIDIKSGVVGILSAMDFLFLSGWIPKRSFYVAFGHDEEVGGSDGAKQIGQLLLKRNVSLDFLIDEGTPLVQGIFPGIEAPIAMIGVTEKGRMDIRISTEGEGGHSSIPPKRQAVQQLAFAIANLYRYPQPSMFGLGPEKNMFQYLAPKASWPHKFIFSNAWLFGPLLSYVMSQKRESDAILRTTTAVTIVNAGYKLNVIPASAQAVINHRVHPSQKLEDVVAHDRAAIADEKVKVEVLTQMEPLPISPYGPKSKPYMLITGAVKHVFPDAVTAPGTLVANTDTGHYLKLTKNVYRLLPLVLTSSQIRRVHGSDERISVKNFFSAIKFYRAIILGGNNSPTETFSTMNEICKID